jgi:hypothetical protein
VQLAACLLALGVGLPFPLVSAVKTPAHRGGEGSTAQAGQSDDSFIHFDSGWVMKNPRRGFGGRRWPVVLLTLGIAAAVFSGHGKRAAALVGAVAVTVVVLFFPPTCTLMVRVLGSEWIVGRLQIVMQLAVIALLAPVAVSLMEAKLRAAWARSMVCLAVLPLSILYAGHARPYDWVTYLTAAFGSREKRHDALGNYRDTRSFLAEHLPPGAAVLVDDELGMWFVAFYDCRIVAAASSNNGVVDLVQRREDLRSLLAAATPWPTRRELLRRYDIRHFAPTTTAGEWARPYVKNWWPGGGSGLAELNVD